jgi:hypothetical protein
VSANPDRRLSSLTPAAQEAFYVAIRPLLICPFDGNGDGNPAELWRHVMNSNERCPQIQCAMNFSELWRCKTSIAGSNPALASTKSYSASGLAADRF